jgi:hypothetical protein
MSPSPRVMQACRNKASQNWQTNTTSAPNSRTKSEPQIVSILLVNAIPIHARILFLPVDAGHAADAHGFTDAMHGLTDDLELRCHGCQALAILAVAHEH